MDQTIESVKQNDGGAPQH